MPSLTAVDKGLNSALRLLQGLLMRRRHRLRAPTMLGVLAGQATPVSGTMIRTFPPLPKVAVDEVREKAKGVVVADVVKVAILLAHRSRVIRRDHIRLREEANAGRGSRRVARGAVLVA